MRLQADAGGGPAGAAREGAGVVKSKKRERERCSRCGRFMTIWVWADPEPFGVRTHAACSRQACLDAAEAAYESFHERQEERRGR
ncbi:MAG: hypothetical protein IT371_30360 [Deltaproteobacteria bacterium]|nr:hypothetical protein [Deltaproteobacteria bacterium]